MQVHTVYTARPLSTPHRSTPRIKPHQFSQQKSNSIEIVWISHGTRSDEILYRRDTYVTTSGTTEERLTIQHRTKPRWPKFTLTRTGGLTLPPRRYKSRYKTYFLSLSLSLYWAMRVVTEEGPRRKKERRGGEGESREGGRESVTQRGRRSRRRWERRRPPLFVPPAHVNYT